MRATASTRFALPVDDVRPRRRVRVLEVGHEDARAGVERVDHHLPVDRAGDLDAALAQVRRRLGHAPVAVADLARLGQEVGQLAGASRCPALGARGEQLAPPRAELALQQGDELERFGREDLGRARCRGSSDRDPGRRRHRHLRIPSIAAHCNQSRIVLVDRLHKLCLCIRSSRRSSRSCAAARSPSAARALYVTQPALTARLNALERDVGVAAARPAARRRAPDGGRPRVPPVRRARAAGGGRGPRRPDRARARRRRPRRRLRVADRLDVRAADDPQAVLARRTPACRSRCARATPRR